MGFLFHKKIDTGAQCNVIPLTILKMFDAEPDLCPVNIKLSAYNNCKIPVLGKCSLTLKQNPCQNPQNPCLS